MYSVNYIYVLGPPTCAKGTKFKSKLGVKNTKFTILKLIMISFIYHSTDYSNTRTFNQNLR